MLKTLQLSVIVFIACIRACADAHSTKSPTVALGDIGTAVGINNSTSGLHSFLGIPYAQSPLGPLRWRLPAPLTSDPSRVIHATAWGPACIQAPNLLTYNTSEDCLFVNVVRPAGLKATAKLPVFVWIHGGGFLQGGSAQYDPTLLVQKSVQLGEPIVYVSMDYRLGAYGFLASREVLAAQKEGKATLNAGLHDIQAALLWVQKYIDIFGGDRKKVTVAGQSAGAVAVGSFLVAGRGNAVQNLKLFRGAILQSGSPSVLGVPPAAYFEDPFRRLVSLVGCGDALSKGTSLECLRRVPADKLTNASIAILPVGLSVKFPFARAQDGYFHDATPSTQVRGGRLATVPILTGDTLDEGTFIANTTLNTTAEVAYNLITTAFLDDDASPAFKTKLIPELLRLYPDDPTIGSPYAPVNASKSDRFYGPKNQYKRVASILGDTVFNSGRRLLLDGYIKKSRHYPVYNYLFTEYTPGTPPALGVWHGTDIAYVFGRFLTSAPDNSVSHYMSSAWIAFANNLNPNRPHLPKWPTYGPDRATLQIGTDAHKPDGPFAKVIKDDFRKEPIAFLESEEWLKEVYS